MIWIHDIEIDRAAGGETLDATTGQPTGNLRYDPVYRGRGRQMGNELRIARLSDGDARWTSAYYVYLPPGSYDIRDDDVVRCMGVQGRVKKVSLWATGFYTQLECQLEKV